MMDDIMCCTHLHSMWVHSDILFVFCINKQINTINTKKAIVLHHLTVDNKPTSDYIAKFIRFFEGDTAFYLVMEKAGNTNLEEFSKQAHEYIHEKKLKLKEWKKVSDRLLLHKNNSNMMSCSLHCTLFFPLLPRIIPK